MNRPADTPLALGQKLDLLVTVFRREPIRTLLDRLTTRQLVEAHGFLWDKLVEIHYLTQKGDFVRENVTDGMVSSAKYQREQGCDLPLDYCKGVECIWSNPLCAGNKVKNNMEVMAQKIVDYLRSSETAGLKESKPKRKQADIWI
ncbi:MAG: hypothetical protein D6743_13315 [Calditrichaeota bacterium]|nr:MAG: hypothetical protein D6743_13315 [Calditrichota bacterium]